MVQRIQAWVTALSGAKIIFGAVIVALGVAFAAGRWASGASKIPAEIQRIQWHTERLDTSIFKLELRAAESERVHAQQSARMDRQDQRLDTQQRKIDDTWRWTWCHLNNVGPERCKLLRPPE